MQRVRKQKGVVTNLNFPFFGSVRGRRNRDQTADSREEDRTTHASSPDNPMSILTLQGGDREHDRNASSEFIPFVWESVIAVSSQRQVLTLFIKPRVGSCPGVRWY
jgi:hypothetical protein